MISPLLRRVALGVCLTATAALAASVASPERFVFHHENVLGTSMELRLRARDATAAAGAESLALAEIDHLARVFSTYSPDSEVSRWQRTRGEAVPVSPELFEVLEQCDRWRDASHGAFNPTAEVFSRLWKSAAATQSEPSSEALSAAALRANQPAWKLDPAHHTATHLSDCPLTLNAIAKGYIIERASERAHQSDGVEGVMLEIGGDLRVRGRFIESIALTDPRHDAENASPIGTVPVREAALTTSGNYRRGTEAAGRHRSHIIDPRTGEPADRVLGATVIAGDTTTADALSTTFSVMDPVDSLRLAEATPGVACLLTLADGRTVHSARWPESGPTLVVDDAKAGAAQGADAKAEPPMELAVDFELARPDGERYRRPYVAIWVEDTDGFPVRTVLLWVLQSPKGARWIPDLRRWRRADDTRRLADDKDLVATTSGATRNPGKYSVVWDGKDDAGVAVKPGKYTLYLETAREHGPYSLVKHEFTVGEQSFNATLKGNEDIQGATLEFRRRSPRK
jgi:thiamine biosynthesis lipoprotein ApbE